MHILEKLFRRHLDAFSSELFTYSDINKGHFSFRKAYYIITIIIQLISNTLQYGSLVNMN